MNKKIARLKRASKSRAIIRSLDVHRLSVNRTPRHIYAQITTADGSIVICSSSTLDPTVKSELSGTGNAEAAARIGSEIAKKAIEAGVKQVAFDRSGFKYHGRVKALAEAAREAGLAF